MEAISYKSYTIQPSLSPFGGFDFFPTEEGMDQDNVKRADTIEEAKDLINEKIMTELPDHKVRMNGREYSFPWIVDALRFAEFWKGEVLTPIESI
jgi:hypothetical protein